MIYAFPLDYIDMYCLKIMKKFYVINLIFNKNCCETYVNSLLLRQELFKQIIHLKSFMPHEFQRKPRSFVPNLKASELHFIALYAGPIIFKGILNSNLYNHFLLFSTALRILCGKFCIKFNNAALTSKPRKFFVNLKEKEEIWKDIFNNCISQVHAQWRVLRTHFYGSGIWVNVPKEHYNAFFPRAVWLSVLISSQRI